MLFGTIWWRTDYQFREVNVAKEGTTILPQNLKYLKF